MLARACASGAHAIRSFSSVALSPIVPRKNSFGKWYNSVVDTAGLTDASPVRGCAILRPHGYALWEAIQRDLDARIKAQGVMNAYFPLLIPTSYLSKEAQHIEGFAKECAVVTHHRLRACADGNGVEVDPTAKLADPYVIRPTSETVIWDAFSRWIQSHRDLPLLLNQWANVVRWEMRTRPFVRTSEFLWQEGHTAHASKEEGSAFARQMLAVYSGFLREVLAIPHVTGVKSSSERFAGADDTYTCEAMMGNGWALQAATSHDLGQHFSKAFGVHYTDTHGVRQQPWATSWGASTRLIGGAIMTHSDDTGLVVPPAIAPIQVVIVPIVGGKVKRKDGSKEAASAGVQACIDDDVHTPPGQRFFNWERKGVALRIEVGPRDLEAGKSAVKPRIPVPGWSFVVPLAGDEWTRILCQTVSAALNSLQQELYSQALVKMQSNIYSAVSFAELQHHAAVADAASVGDALGDEGENQSVPVLGPGPFGKDTATHGSAAPYSPPYKMFLVPWHDDAAAEAEVKARTKYTVRCFPSENGPKLHELQSQEHAAGKNCFFSKRPATHMALFARAF